jgi:hypothetical protein
MFSRKIVKKVLKKTLALDFENGKSRISHVTDHDTAVSMLIRDVFGGEILKTPKRNGWHFYNRINGERLDFSGTKNEKFNDGIKFKDIPATPDETAGYFDKTDYSTFFMRFVKAFEETIGLGKQKYGLSA